MKCPNCSGSTVSPEGPMGEKVCPSCGLVIEAPANTRSFTQWTPQWHANWHENDSETLKEWLTTLRTVSCQLNIPKFPYTEEAARTIRKGNHLLAQSQRFGKNKRATIAALMHLILKEYHKDRPLKDICQQLSLDNTLVMKQTWMLNQTIKTQNQLLNIQRKTNKDYLLDYGTKVTNDAQLLREAQQILATQKGGNPIATAAGALYFACKLNKTKINKEQIAKAFGISARTVDSNERKIRQHHKPTTTATSPSIAIAKQTKTQPTPLLIAQTNTTHQ